MPRRRFLVNKQQQRLRKAIAIAVNSGGEIFVKEEDIVIADKHLVRLATPPKNTRPGKLAKSRKRDNQEAKNPA